MKLEFLDDITGGGRYPLADPKELLRLYDFDDFELMTIRHLIKRSLIDRDGQIIISNLDFVNAMNCTLTLGVASEDAGIILTGNNGRDFYGEFCRETYINMVGIIDHLGDGYNWLYDPRTENEIDFLISGGGTW